MKSIGKYQVVEELGTSAAGTTYRVRDSFRSREFAAKVLHSGAGLTAEAREQFCRDLADCAELSHRHLVKVHDLGEVEEGIYLATELLSGVSLGHFMEENRDLPLGQKLGVIAQVAEGLAFVHSRNFAHGDIKPSNIMVDAARNATILDFGIGKWLASVLAAGSRLEGLLPNYFAPEQVLGQPFDTRSDLFSLALILYEFIAGKYPFSVAPSLIPREIVHSDPEPLRKLDPHVPEGLEQLVARALCKNPEQRLQTAEEFAAGLYAAAQQLRRAEAAAAPVLPPIEAAPPPVQATAFETPKTVQPGPAPVEIPIASPPAAIHTGPPPAPAPEPVAAVVAEPVAPLQPPAVVIAAPLEAQSAPAAQPAPAPQPVAKPARPNNPAGARPAGARPAAAKGAPVRKPAKSSRRAFTIVAGALLAVCIVAAFVSRQNLTASQNKSHAASVPAPSTPIAVPAATPIPAPSPSSTSALSEPEPPATPVAGKAESSSKQILSGPVRSLWESGKYAQALGLVNRVLADDPENAEARAWEKKIREAQAAEAALK